MIKHFADDGISKMTTIPMYNLAQVVKAGFKNAPMLVNSNNCPSNYLVQGVHFGNEPWPEVYPQFQNKLQNVPDYDPPYHGAIFVHRDGEWWEYGLCLMAPKDLYDLTDPDLQPLGLLELTACLNALNDLPASLNRWQVDERRHGLYRDPLGEDVHISGRRINWHHLMAQLDEQFSMCEFTGSVCLPFFPSKERWLIDDQPFLHFLLENLPQYRV